MKPHKAYFLLAILCACILVGMILSGYRDKKCVHTPVSSAAPMRDYQASTLVTKLFAIN